MSSIDRIFSNGVLGLQAQANALSAVSDNVANATTTGYKSSDTQFSDFIVKDKYGSTYGGAGVMTTDRLLADKQGSLTQTAVNTNAAIIGNGFFVVQNVNNAFGDRELSSAELTAKGNDPELTRAGDFSVDAYGHLVNSNGFALLGQELDATVGDTTALPTSTSQLDLIDVGAMRTYYEGSTAVSVKGALPAAQEVAATTGDGITSTIKVIGTDGRPAAITLNYVKTGKSDDGFSTWDIYTTGGTYADGTAVSGIDTTNPVGSLLFGGDYDGTAATNGPGLPWAKNATIPTTAAERTALADSYAAGDPIEFNLSLGSNFTSPVTLNVGNYRTANGLTATGTEADVLASASNDTDGIAANTSTDSSGATVYEQTMTELTITDDGYVRGSYAGGQQRDFYRVPLGYVRNPQGVEAVSGTVYRVSQDSGSLQLKTFGATPGSSLLSASTGTTSTGTTSAVPTANIGTQLVTNAIEQSNTDISKEFTTLIVAQRTYSANSKVISTADELTQTLLQLK